MIKHFLTIENKFKEQTIYMNKSGKFYNKIAKFYTFL